MSKEQDLINAVCRQREIYANDAAGLWADLQEANRKIAELQAKVDELQKVEAA